MNVNVRTGITDMNPPTLRSRVTACETSFFPSIALLHTLSHPYVVLGRVREGVGVPFSHLRPHLRPCPPSTPPAIDPETMLCPAPWNSGRTLEVVQTVETMRWHVIKQPWSSARLTTAAGARRGEQGAAGKGGLPESIMAGLRTMPGS